MKRKFPLFLVVVLLLTMALPPAAHAVSAGLPSRERDDSEISIDESGVPLVEFPAAEITADVTVDEPGAATAGLRTAQILEAVESVVSGDAVSITITATADADNVNTVSTVLPKEALAAVVERTAAEVVIVTNAGQMTLPNAAIASIVEEAGGEDVTFNMTSQTVEMGRELLEEVLDGAMDITEARIKNGSVTGIAILSGGKNITSWDGDAVILNLPIGSGCFEQNKGYRVIQISADMSRTEHTGRCVMGAAGLYVEVSITHLSTFVVLADAVEENMSGDSASMVVSPLAARDDGGSDNSAGTDRSYMWFAAAGLVLAACVTGGVVLKDRRKG